MANTGDLVRRVYSGFRGVDFRGDECALNRSPDALNVWKNYRNKECIETRPALVLEECGSGYLIEDVRFVNGTMFTKYASQIHNHDNNTVFGLGVAHMMPFQYGDYAYSVTESGCWRYNEKKTEVADPYIPTTSDKGKPMPLGSTTYTGGREAFEDVNLLTKKRKNSFIGDGVNKIFFLDYEGAIKNVSAEDIDGNTYDCTYSNGLVITNLVPPASQKDNFTITFEIDDDEWENPIAECTINKVFDNRVWYSGNPKYPNRVWYSALDNPLYVKSLDCYDDGKDNAKIVDMAVGHNGIWVFREPCDTHESVFYHVPALDEVEGKIYPSTHSNISLGCVGKATNFNDSICFFSQRGMEGQSADITTEQFVVHRSSLIDRHLVTNPKYKDMVLVEWEGYLCVFVGSDVYLADSRAVLTNENHIEYEWYHWNLGDRAVSCATENDGVLYVGTYKLYDDGTDDKEDKTSQKCIYSFTGDPKNGDEVFVKFVQSQGQYVEEKGSTPIQSHWTTPKDKFNAPTKAKTTNKKGFVVEATGDIDLYAKADRDEDFEIVSEHRNINDHFVGKVKKKKFKDVQLQFKSTTKFSLESATLESIVGGYIKE